MYLTYLDKFKNMTPYLLIDATEWTYIKETFDMNDVVDTLSQILMEYPLPYSDITIDDARNDFMKLKGVRWNEHLVEGEWTARHIYSYPFEYRGKPKYFRRNNVGNNASNFFQQENRWEVDATQSPGPARTWTTLSSMKSMCRALFTLGYDVIDKKALRSAISLRKYICSQFKPNVAKMIYEMFDAKVVLDFSAGWGDRLAGFYASMDTETYIGIDPRKENHPIYREQSKFYDKNLGWFEKKKSVYLYESPAEDWDNSEWVGKVDLIFTSPPYFNTERYSKDDTQSWVRYKGINDWNEKFLHKALKNVWETLKPGGIMIVNIADIYDRSVKSYVKICDPMVEYMKTIDDCIFEGVIGMEMSARPGTNSQDRDTTFCEPCWIFKKE